MSVSLYLGLPGDGKSMSGVRKVVAVLTGGNRYVITNLPLELGELQSYLCKEYGNDFSCMRRVVLLQESQVRKYWLVRGEGWRLLDISEEQYGRGCFPSLQKVYRWVGFVGDAERGPIEQMSEREVSDLVARGMVECGDLGKEKLGAVYIIDECQNFWPARSFQSTPKGLPFYLTQHRHVGDDCIFITQKEAQVEKVVRNLVSEFWVFKRVGVRRRLGFRLPDVFGYSCFSESPSAPGAIYQSLGSFRMDVDGLSKCYRTADGVGVGGPTMEADTKHKPSGLSWKWAVAGLLMITLVACFMPGAFAKIISRFFLGTANQVAKHVAPVTNAVVQRVSSTNDGYASVNVTIVQTNVVIQRPIGIARSNDVGIVGALHL